MSPELFVEVTRNGTVESQHFGAAVVCDFKGAVLESWGDIEKLVFPRSALKPFQAIGVVESGASDRYALGNAEISLASASHRGEPMHLEGVTSWLARLGLNQDHLACGAELPEDEPTARQLLASGQEPCRYHHNCSGKHVAFLTTALHLKEPVANYHQVGHPVQQMSLDVISDLSQTEIRNYPMGIDGCGFPAPAMPLVNLGIAMARFANPSELPDSRARAIRRIHEAVTDKPLYVAGHGSVVSELIQVTSGAILAKTGAEGVLIAALPRRGIGIALKIADGNARARPVALLAILDLLGALSAQEKHRLRAHINPEITNSQGLVVGEIRPAASWMEAR